MRVENKEKFKIEELNKEYERNAVNYGADIENTILEQIPRCLHKLVGHWPFGKIISKVLGLRLEVLPTDILDEGFQTGLYKRDKLIKVFVFMF